jgi:glycosyltransferase involved in cell wall biosynthesis
MKILINCSTLKKGGVLQVGHSFVSECFKRSDHEYYFILSSTLAKDFQIPMKQEDKRVFTYDTRPSVFLSLTGKEKYLNRLLAQIDPDVVFTVFGPSYWKPDRPHLVGFAKAGYFYPDSPFVQQMPFFRKLKVQVLKLFHMYDFKNFNQAIVTETSDTSQRLAGLLPAKKIFTVSNTYNQIFNEPEKWEKGVLLPDFDGVTMLSITANYRHKNLSIIPQVIDYLREHHPRLNFRFVLTLKREDYQDIEEKHARHILFLGRVSIYEAPALYKQSDFMFMPTLLECFSATYPEAMKMENPVLTSDMPFARAVCGEAAIYFDPQSPASIGEAIYSLASSEALRSEMIERGRKRLETFETATSRAQKYIEILKNL